MLWREQVFTAENRYVFAIISPFSQFTIVAYTGTSSLGFKNDLLENVLSVRCCRPSAATSYT